MVPDPVCWARWIAFVAGAQRDNPTVMTSPAERPIWERHPLWGDPARLDAIREQMWIQVQKTMFPGRARRPLKNPDRTELTLVGGASASDAYNEAVHALLSYVPVGEANWEALGNTIARRRAIAALRKARKHRGLPDGSEITIASLDVEGDDGELLAAKVADDEAASDEQAVELALRADRLIAFRVVANEVLTQRDRDIVFRVARNETHADIAEVVGLTPQRVGQIYRESLRKINGRLREDPKYRRLYEDRGGNQDV